MKKYLTLAFVLGAIAFVSVSYLAKAEPTAAPAMTAAATPAAVVAPAAAPAADAFAKDSDACSTMAAAPAADAAAPTADAKDAAFKKCMLDKGYTEEALKKAADEKAAAPAAK